MELICPECRADLVVADAQNADCITHNGRYQILFDRSAPPAAAAGVEPAVVRPTHRTLNETCRQHPDTPAVARCRICSRGVCATCDFLLPGNVHVCPACLEKEPATEVAPKRRNLMIGAVAVAAYCTLMFVLLMSGTLHRAFGRGEAVNAILGNAILLPAIG